MVTDAFGSIEASGDMVALQGNASSDGEVDWFCHAHIPSDPDTVFVSLARVAGNSATIQMGAYITTTIVSLG